MEDNRTSGARFIDDIQSEQLTDLRNEFHAVASTHLTKEYFFWAFGIFVSLTLLAMGGLLESLVEHEREDDTRFSKIDEQHQQFINQNTGFQVTYAKIEVQLAQIQKDLLDLKTSLNTHDKK
jgi:hypothetical protein